MPIRKATYWSSSKCVSYLCCRMVLSKPSDSFIRCASWTHLPLCHMFMSWLRNKDRNMEVSGFRSLDSKGAKYSRLLSVRRHKKARTTWHLRKGVPSRGTTLVGLESSNLEQLSIDSSLWSVAFTSHSFKVFKPSLAGVDTRIYVHIWYEPG